MIFFLPVPSFDCYNIGKSFGLVGFTIQIKAKDVLMGLVFYRS